MGGPAAPIAAASSICGVIVTISAAGADAIGSHAAENISDRTIDGDRRCIAGDSGGIWGPAGPHPIAPGRVAERFHQSLTGLPAEPAATPVAPA